MYPLVSADVRGGERLRDEPKERLRRRLHNSLMYDNFIKNFKLINLPTSAAFVLALHYYAKRLA